MKHKKRNLIILAIILIFVVGVYIGVKIYNKSQIQQDGEESISMLSFDADNIEKLEYTSSEEKLAFTKSDGTWVYDADKDFPLDCSNIEAILSTASNLTATRKLKTNIDNIDEYGLDNPLHTLKVTDIDGKEIYIYIGIQNPVSMNYYSYSSEEDTVYMIDSTLTSYLSYGLYDMMICDNTDS